VQQQGKAWLKENKGVPDAEFLAILDVLYRRRSFEEKVLASTLLSYHRAGRRTIGTKQLEALSPTQFEQKSKIFVIMV
jgi:hypothetical protein